MKPIHRLRGRRLLGVLAALAVVAVAIPAASGAGPFARAGSKSLCRHVCSSAALISPSTLKMAMAKPKHPGHPPGPGKYTCNGGSIPAGSYDSLTVAGFCTVDAGDVQVKHDLNVQANGGLLAAFGDGPQLAVRGNLNVGSNGVLVLGCEPEAFTCFNDPDQQVGSFGSRGTVFGNIKADNALAVIIHNSSIGHDLTIHGGGGGVTCDGQDALFGSPAYATTEDVAVGHNVNISGLQTCWSGFFRTSVGGSFKYKNNTTADPDGNEVQTNVVQKNIDCNGNDPAPQQGDSGGFANITFGKITGDCVPAP